MPGKRDWVYQGLFSLWIMGLIFAGCPGGGELVEPAGGGGGQPVAAVQPTEEETKPLEVVKWSGKFDEGWKEYDRLVNEQKYEQASKLVEDMLEKAKSTGNPEEWVRGIIRYVKLRSALHGYETSVRFLKEQEWPKDLLGSATLNLFYAQSLTTYAQVYSWEIRQRERVESKGAVDLKAWTLDQIYEEALRAYQEVWKHREQLGEHPVAHLAEHIQSNDYPSGIRGTLRDAVSYLYLQLLSDTSGWRPEHSNELYQLELERLIGTKKKAGQVALGDPGVHPLLKACSILEDLEGWHARSKEAEGAFEARLRRLRVLQANFTQGADRERIRGDLEERLPKVRQVPWWSMGMSALAEFVREEEAPDSLVRAREIAMEGNRAYPDSVGGRRCLHIAKSIEMPGYQLQGMAVDSAGKASVGVSYRNLGKLYFRAYPVDLKKQIESTDDYDLFPSYRKLESMLRNRKPSHKWEVVLAATPDFKMHQAQLVPPMTRPGFYVVIASAREDFGKSDNQLHGVHLVIGDLVLVTRQEHSEVQVDVLSGAGGGPVAGVKVSLYRYDYQNRHKAVDSKVTGPDGSVNFARKDQSSYFLFAQKGQQVAVDPNYLYLYGWSEPAQTYATLLYTDRSIYRPQQTLHFKAVAYSGRYDRGDYQLSPGTPLVISLMDANYQEVAKKAVTTNSYGTASGEFVIPAGRLLGQWQLRSSRNGVSVIQVEEYQRPKFEARLLDPKSPLRLNKPAAIKGEARYYFGLPVASGKAKWRVTRSPVYPWWWSYYGWWEGQGSGSSRTQTIAAGAAGLMEDGTFTIEFTPAADERLAQESKELSYSYSVTVDVTDEGGETRTASRAFRLGWVDVEAVVRTEVNFFLEDLPGELTIVRSNLNGVPEKGKGSYRIVALTGPGKALLPVEQPLLEPPGKRQEKGYATPGDRQRTRWDPRYQPEAVLRGWADGAERARGVLQHDDKGEAQVKLPGLAAGAYRLHYTTKDAFGANYQMSKEFIVAGKQDNLALPAHLLVERGSVGVGETARVYVVSGLAGQPMFVDIYRDGRRTQRRRLESGKDSCLIEIPIDESRRGGFGVTLTALRDHQFMHFVQSVFVPWDNQELQVEFSTFRDLLRPGAKERWTVKVTGPAKAQTPARAAEVLAYMYDRSLDAFVGHNPPSPLSLFPSRTQVAWARPSVGYARGAYVECYGFTPPPGYPPLQEDYLKFYSGYGIGGLGARRHSYRGSIMALHDQAGSPASTPMAVAEEDDEQANVRSRETSRSDSGVRATGQPAKAPMEKAKSQVGQTEQSGEAPSGRVELRTDFSETAFWHPHLLTGEDGSVSFEFEVPDSVTSWNVWVHAVTRDLRSGSLRKETRTVKDLMVRPYLPRFLREGDAAELKVVVNNASDRPLQGRLSFDIIDPETDKSILDTFGLGRDKASGLPFAVEPKGGTNLSFAVKTPARIGLIAFKVTAASGQLSDGELRPIPVLPGRMHLAQSRFVTLRDKSRREMKFEDMLGDDPSLLHEQLVVTIDAQLFYSVLSAIPYLVNYPYECTEQTLNRFISTGILASMYRDYPAIERMAKKFSQRQTEFETWEAADPNRKMALEETPWVQEAKGGPEREYPLINVLDPNITRAQRDASLAKLRKAQTSSGGFPWFPGGPPSPYMTLYLLYGFSKGLEFGVDVPRDMIQRAWQYTHRHYLDEAVRQMMVLDCCWEFITFLNYTLSNYPAPDRTPRGGDASWTGGVFSELERKVMLDFSFRHWKQHSPYLKGYLALTLNRMDRRKDAVLVWESVMDSAKTAEDQGTFWAPEDRGWLWYNDTIETHAFAVRTLMELVPKDEKLDGLVLWLFLNKKLNHWKSTRATAEVIYSLAHYLKQTAQLGVKEEIRVTAGDLKKSFVFRPDEYTGKKSQIVIPGEQVDPKQHSVVVVEKETPGHAFASATWHFSTERLPAEDRGDFLGISRSYFKRVKTGREVKLLPLKENARLEVGDEVEVHLSLTTKHPVEYVHLRDPRPAGFEPVDLTSKHKWNLGIYWYEEIRDSGTNFFFESLPQGNYPFSYRLRATIAGTFKAAPATVQPMYAPEFAAYSAGQNIHIAPAE